MLIRAKFTRFEELRIEIGVRLRGESPVEGHGCGKYAASHVDSKIEAREEERRIQEASCEVGQCRNVIPLAAMRLRNEVSLDIRGE
jgi:hypothetical protein